MIKRHVLFYPLAGHELLPFRRVEVVPGDGRACRRSLEKMAFILFERIHEGAVVHVEHVDLDRIVAA